MGNVSPTYIKRVAIELVEKYPDQFSQDFPHNKEKLSEFNIITKKGMRNRIAGYVTRYYKRHNRGQGQ